MRATYWTSNRKIKAVGLIGLLILMAGCSSDQTPTATSLPPPVAVATATSAASAPSKILTPTPRPTATNLPLAPTVTPVPQADGPATYAYTHQQPDGNRWISGQGSLPNAAPLDIPLAGAPGWVLAAALPDGGSLWVVTLEDGHTL